MTLVHDLVTAVAPRSAQRLADSLVIGLALVVFAWVLLRLLPRQNSATRFAVWFSALLATAVLPWFDLGSKAARVTGHIAAAPHALISVPSAWALYLFVAWAAIATLALARVAVGLIALWRLRRHCRRISIGGAAWHQLAARGCPARRVALLSSDRIHVPTAIGFFHPAVVVPAGLLGQLNASELNQLLLHELAHLRRWDDWTNLMQKFIKAVLFFHPAVWWVEQRLSLEREMACDDAVLAETGSPRAYAECLALLAEKALVRRSAALAQAAVNRIRQTSLRVARILNSERSNAVPVRKSAVALVGAFACACVAVAWQAPQLVAFQSAPHQLRSLAAIRVPSRPAAVRDSNPQPAQKARLSADYDATPRTAETLAAKQALFREHLAPRKTRLHAHARILARANSDRQPLRRAQAATEIAAVAKGFTAGNHVHSWDAAASTAPAIEARASARPVVATGVVIIVVNDPVLGPTPILYRFAVWQVAPQHASQSGAGLPPKAI